MKILMLTNVIAPDKLGGLERYVRELSAALSKKGVTVWVASKRTSPDQAAEEIGPDGVNVVRYDPPRKSDPTFAARYPLAISSGVNTALKRLGDTSDVVVHGHFPVPMLPILARRRKFVYTCHAPVYKEVRSERQGSYLLPGPLESLAVSGMRALERKIVRSADGIVTLSEFVRTEVASLDAAAAGAVTLIPGGIDLHRFLVRNGANHPRELGGDGPVIFAARRMVLRTGVEQLVQAFALLREQGLGARLVLAGDGPRRAAIEDFVRAKGLQESVHLLGRISEEELVGWYQSAYLAVTPTQELEGFGLSTAEAMACGAAPFVTPVGANGEVVQGLPVEALARGASPQDIADGLRALLLDPALTSVIRQTSPGVAAKYGWEAVAERHIEFYETRSRRTV